MKNKLLLGGVVILIGLIAFGSNLFYTGAQHVYYPLTGTLICKLAGQNTAYAPEPSTGYFTTAKQFTCDATTCEIDYVVVNKDLTYGGRHTGLLHIFITDASGSTTEQTPSNWAQDWTSGDNKFSLSSPLKFAYGETVALKLEAEKGFFTDPVPIVNWKTSITKNYRHVALYLNPALEGGEIKVGGDSVNGVCGVNPQLVNNNPTDTSKVDSVMQTVGHVLGKTYYSSRITNEWLTRSVGQMREGDTYTFIDKYMDLPTIGNVRDYNGKQIICSSSKHEIVYLAPLSTEGGNNYLVPESWEALPVNGCCSNEECTAKFGSGYLCNAKLTCEKGVGTCDTLHPCPQPVYSSQNGKFIKTYYSCISGQCQAKQTQVACSPSFCAQYGKQCDDTRGCIGGATSCGNGVIDAGETCNSCPQDLQANGYSCSESGAKNCTALFGEGYKWDENLKSCVYSPKGNALSLDMWSMGIIALIGISVILLFKKKKRR